MRFLKRESRIAELEALGMVTYRSFVVSIKVTNLQIFDLFSLADLTIALSFHAGESTCD